MREELRSVESQLEEHQMHTTSELAELQTNVTSELAELNTLLQSSTQQLTAHTNQGKYLNKQVNSKAVYTARQCPGGGADFSLISVIFLVRWRGNTELLCTVGRP